MRDKIKKLHKERINCTDSEKAKKINDNLDYLYAKKNERTDTYRSQEIAKRVAKKYSLDKQIEILLNDNKDEIKALKEYRKQVAHEVDVLINQYENEIN